LERRSTGIGQSLGKRDYQSSTHCCDRVQDVAFSSQRRSLWVGNRREWQVLRAALTNLLRGEPPMDIVDRIQWRLARSVRLAAFGVKAVGALGNPWLMSALPPIAGEDERRSHGGRDANAGDFEASSAGRKQRSTEAATSVAAIICLLASVVDRIMAPPCSPRKLPA
jgi:hypothetical protein